MPSFKPPRSFSDRLMSTCLGLLACAIVVFVAVHLVLAVVWPLLIIVSVVTVVTGTLAFLRYRHHGW